MSTKRFLTVSITLFIIVIASIVACNKENSSSANPIFFLTNQPWHFERYDEDGGIDGTIDYTESPDICRAGASYTFRNDNIVVYTPAANLCDSNDVVDKSTWALINNAKTLSWFGTNYTIESLNDSVLNITYDSVYSFNNQPYRAHLVYKH